MEAGRLPGCPVLASGHQADFCRWLGLRVVKEISSADNSRVVDLDEAIKAGEAAGVRVIVANEPEGRRAADAVADRLQARVVVFANFPEPAKNRRSTIWFDATWQPCWSLASGVKKKGTGPFVRSTLRAVAANGACPLFPSHASERRP